MKNKLGLIAQIAVMLNSTVEPIKLNRSSDMYYKHNTVNKPTKPTNKRKKVKLARKANLKRINNHK